MEDPALAGTFEVQRPDVTVYVNKERLNNSTAKYPVFTYKDILYFPMTWSYTQALGIDTGWNATTGFSIGKSDKQAEKLTPDTGASGAKLRAKYPDFNITINGSWLDNANEPYPVLVMNDITYFPMTWKFAVDELGLSLESKDGAFYISK
ncbi:hypothetical protein GCM10020370_55010 [Paenibacillus hodogayensis]